MTERPLDSNRRPLMIYLDVIDRNSGEVIGRLGDVSHDGLMLLSDAPMATNVQLPIGIIIPDDLDLGEHRIDLEVETRWSRPDANPAVHCTGCHLIRSSANDQAILAELAQRLAFDATD